MVLVMIMFFLVCFVGNGIPLVMIQMYDIIGNDR